MTLHLMIVGNGQVLWERRVALIDRVACRSDFQLENALLEFAAAYPDGQVQLVARIA